MDPACPGTTLTAFTPGDLVISVYGAANGTGTYTLDQASAITLEELTPAGVVAGNLVLPQTTTVVNGTIEYALSGEYGSASEGTLQLSVDGQSLVTFGYGVNAAAFNMAGASGNSAYGNAALGQSTSTTNGVYIPVSREVANIGYNAAIDTSTSVYNIYNTNNPRSAATVNGTTFYLSGQSVKGSTDAGRVPDDRRFGRIDGDRHQHRHPRRAGGERPPVCVARLHAGRHRRHVQHRQLRCHAADHGHDADGAAGHCRAGHADRGAGELGERWRGRHDGQPEPLRLLFRQCDHAVCGRWRLPEGGRHRRWRATEVDLQRHHMDPCL